MTQPWSSAAGTVASGSGAAPPYPAGTWAALGLILVATVWAYTPALWGGFIWDDNSYVAYNTLLHDWDGLRRIWFEPTATPQYHPLVFSTYWVEYRIWGDATFGYHVVNVALHAATTVIAFALLRRLAIPGALFAAAVFALHPVHVESVAWITERKDVLSAFFYGLTLWWWLNYLESERESAWIVALGLAAATLLSKTVLCTLPVAMAILAVWVAPQRWHVWSVRLAPFVALSIPIAWITIWREHSHGNPPLPYSFLERTLIASRALWTHAGLLIWPVDLTIVYAKWPVSTTDPLSYVFPLAGLAGVATLWSLRGRFGDGPLVAVAFFVVTLGPMIGFVDFNIMRYAYVADHFQYVGGMGLIALAAAAGRWALSGVPAGAMVAVAVVPLAVLAGLTRQQAALYVDADTIWRDNVAKNPRSWVGHNFLATELMRSGRYEEAAARLREAVRHLPDHADALRTLGLVEASLGNLDDAVAWLRQARRVDPTNPRVEQSLGAVLLSLGRPEEAATHFASAVRLHPEYAEGWHYRGLASALLGQEERAIEFFERALAIRPDYEDAKRDLEGLRGRAIEGPHDRE